MKKRAALFAVLGVLLAATLGLAADSAPLRHPVAFPDLPGYKTLLCDLHTHTVFSDGQVWPAVRVDEAWREGLDAIAITDHIEYQPHKDDIPTRHGRAFDLAASRAKERNLLFPRAAEITRDTPPGHFNALFLSDVNPLDTEDFVEQIKRANEQGAFVFWNHQGWKGAEKGQWLEVHHTLYKNRWLHGMEVANGDTYYPEAHQACLEKGLTMLGTSDTHEPELRQRTAAADHRTMTLVFAKEATLESLKEALFAGRTVVWMEDQLIGREEWLKPLFDRSVRIAPPHYRTKDAVWVQIANTSDAHIKLQHASGPGPAELALPARSVALVKIGTSRPNEPLELSYTATNLLVAPDTGLALVLIVK